MKSVASRAERKQSNSKPRAKETEAPRKRGAYVSDLMIERRRRLIEITKAMIAEKGADGFTIRELTERAQISITLVYSAYGDKEGLVAAAIQDFYETLPTAQRRTPKTLRSVLAQVDEAAEVILANAAYAGSLADLYFSRTVDPRVYLAIRNIAIRRFGPWLEHTIAKKGVVSGLSLEMVYSILANEPWSVIFDWARGRIGDRDLAMVMKTTFLVTASGVTTGPAQAELQRALRKIARNAGRGVPPTQDR